MKKLFALSTAVLSLTVFAVTEPAAAGPKAPKAAVAFSAPTTVAGVQLKPGQYRVEVSADGAVATFYQGRTEVVKAAVHNQPRESKYSNTEVDIADNSLKEIHIGGTTTNLIVEGAAKTSATASR